MTTEQLDSLINEVKALDDKLQYTLNTCDRRATRELISEVINSVALITKLLVGSTTTIPQKPRETGVEL